MKKLTKLLLAASLFTAFFASCSNGSLIANDTLDKPDLTATATENGVIVLKWDDVKDADPTGYYLYMKAPGTEDFTRLAAGATSPYSYPYIDPKYADSEYTFKLVATPDTGKKNLLASETEVSVDTPEAWVDTAAPSADSIKVSLVPNTLNNYTLSFPVDAGFTYSAKLVEATAAATEDAKDLFDGKYSSTQREQIYVKTSTSVTKSVEEWRQDVSNPYWNAQYELNTLVNNLYRAGKIDLSNENSALYAAYNAYSCPASVDVINDLKTELSTVLTTTETVTFVNAAAATTEYEKWSSTEVSYTVQKDYSSISLVASDGAKYITELDDDDNVVSPIVSNTLVAEYSGVEYRVVIKATPKNSQVATTKYVLSSATFKFDATGIVYAPSSNNRTVSAIEVNNVASETKRVLKFYADKYNGTEIAGTNYRIYQVLTTYTQDSEGVDLGSTTTVAKLGTASKDADYDTTDKDNVRYEYEFVINAPSKTEAYNYTWFVVTTSQNGDALWTYIDNDFVDFKN